MSWEKKRAMVWKRDGGICQVCQRKLEPAEYECGHIVDRVCGGLDEIENLVVMCWRCNHLKDPHETREQYNAWIAGGFWRTGLMEHVKKEGFPEEEIKAALKYLGWE